MTANLLTAPQLVATARSTIEEISPAELELRVAAGAVLLDVREPGEFVAGHIAGASNIPRGVLEFKVEAHPAMACVTAPELALRDRPVIVYCLSGGRSALAVQTLHRMGFNAVASLAGGIQKWHTSGRPIVAEG